MLCMGEALKQGRRVSQRLLGLLGRTGKMGESDEMAAAEARGRKGRGRGWRVRPKSETLQGSAADWGPEEGKGGGRSEPGASGLGGSKAAVQSSGVCTVGRRPGGHGSGDAGKERKVSLSFITTSQGSIRETESAYVLKRRERRDWFMYCKADMSVGYLGKSGSHRAGYEEGQAGTVTRTDAVVHRRNFFFLRETLLLQKAFHPFG